MLIYKMIGGTVTFDSWYLPIPVASQSKACVFSHLLAGIAGLNPAEGMDICVVFIIQGQYGI
jgi:hypothetical protein